jgi:hypothetical protein
MLKLKAMDAEAAGNPHACMQDLRPNAEAGKCLLEAGNAQFALFSWFPVVLSADATDPVTSTQLRSICVCRSTHHLHQLLIEPASISCIEPASITWGRWIPGRALHNYCTVFPYRVLSLSTKPEVL